jgi:hypothetical protein
VVKNAVTTVNLMIAFREVRVVVAAAAAAAAAAAEKM